MEFNEHMAEAMNKKNLLKKSDIKQIEYTLEVLLNEIRTLKEEIKNLKVKKETKKAEER